jgi:methylthioribose-1-phosphate isomerase
VVPIEVRDGDELVHIGGTRIAPAGTATLNFAFDVTPADLVTAIVTEHRVVRPAAGERM